MAYQPVMVTLPIPKVLDNPIGFCDTHPALNSVAAYTGPETDSKKKKMCAECWLEFKRKVLRLPDTIFK